jgi:hypothetical protein
VKIKKRHLNYFKAIDPDKLWNKTIIVTGLLKNKKRKRTVTISYPTQLKVVNAKNSENHINDVKKRKPTKLEWSLQK